MSDLISRQAAIDAVNKALDRETIIYAFVRKVAVDSIKTLPAAQPEPSQIARDIATIIENEQDMRVILAQPQWTPVTERLPEEDLTDVLLLYHDKRCGCEDDYYIVQAYTVRGQWRPALRIDDSDMESLEPVAWMPLPAPFKEN